jgi:hypothetical protein
MAVKIDVATSLTSDLTTLISNLFYHHLTYLDLFIRRQIIEDYSIKFFS